MSNSKSEIVEVCQHMLDEKISLIEGCRKLVKLISKNEEDNEIFFPIRAFESDTERFLLGEPRKHAEPNYLRELDQEMDDYIEKSKEDILKACKNIIKYFDNRF